MFSSIINRDITIFVTMPRVFFLAKNKFRTKKEKRCQKFRSERVNSISMAERKRYVFIVISYGSTLRCPLAEWQQRLCIHSGCISWYCQSLVMLLIAVRPEGRGAILLHDAPSSTAAVLVHTFQQHPLEVRYKNGGGGVFYFKKGIFFYNFGGKKRTYGGREAGFVFSKSIKVCTGRLPVYRLFICLPYSVIPYCAKTNFPFCSLISVENVYLY